MRNNLLPFVVFIAVCAMLLTNKALSGTNRQMSERVMKQGTIVAIINTPKCGTGSLHGSFSHSLQCRDGTLEGVDRVTYSTGCRQGIDTVRTHVVDAGAKAIAALRQNPQEKRCVVATAIRHPKTWLPSIFMQKDGRTLCQKDVSYEEFYNAYHEYIMKESSSEFIISSILSARPELFKEFGTTLTAEMEKVEVNGGYSLQESVSTGGRPFDNCELLFLKMEDNDAWPDIIANLYPGIRYRPNEKRVEACPLIADNYAKLAEHQFTDEEKANIIRGNSDVAEYFAVYGL